MIFQRNVMGGSMSSSKTPLNKKLSADVKVKDFV